MRKIEIFIKTNSRVELNGTGPTLAIKEKKWT
jgi:hypothetical protein